MIGLRQSRKRQILASRMVDTATRIHPAESGIVSDYVNSAPQNRASATHSRTSRQEAHAEHPHPNREDTDASYARHAHAAGAPHAAASADTRAKPHTTTRAHGAAAVGGPPCSGPSS